jgi:hypothetical protein
VASSSFDSAAFLRFLVEGRADSPAPGVSASEKQLDPQRSEPPTYESLAANLILARVAGVAITCKPGDDSVTGPLAVGRPSSGIVKSAWPQRLISSSA